MTETNEGGSARIKSFGERCQEAIEAVTFVPTKGKHQIAHICDSLYEQEKHADKERLEACRKAFEKITDTGCMSMSMKAWDKCLVTASVALIEIFGLTEPAPDKEKALGEKEADVSAGGPTRQKDALLKHAATLLRASRYAIRKTAENPTANHDGYYDSVHKLIAVIENLSGERQSDETKRFGERCGHIGEPPAQNTSASTSLPQGGDK